jgi:hypothetical protein
MLLANVPIRVVATLHDTSVKMIERAYSKHIAEHTDAIARRALLDVSQPSAAATGPQGPTGPQRGQRDPLVRPARQSRWGQDLQMRRVIGASPAGRRRATGRITSRAK